jgi:tRNA(adenine34) deaminase
MNDHYHFLRRCDELGRLAAISGNSPAGALIVSDGVIISEGAEAATSKNDITCHAEIEALRAAVALLGSRDLSQCVLYTNYEPCVMCSYAIRYYRISKVIYQRKVPFLGGISSIFPLMTSVAFPQHWAPPPEVIQVPEMEIE